MKVEISESYPGELGEPREELERKLHRALDVTLGETIRKGGLDGRMRVLDELVAGAGDLYAERQKRLRSALLKAIENAR